jgi:hypothetical protein
MPVGIQEMNNVTLQNITDIINMTSGNPIEFFINTNTIAFGGWFYFILLWILAIILWRRAQDKEDQPLINAMHVMAIITILSFLLRAINIVKDGVVWGLLTDFQMWMFPLITVFLAGINRFVAD